MSRLMSRNDYIRNVLNDKKENILQVVSFIEKNIIEVNILCDSNPRVSLRNVQKSKNDVVTRGYFKKDKCKLRIKGGNKKVFARNIKEKFVNNR